MLLMVERGVRGGIYHAIHQYPKANNKYIEDYDKNKKSLYVKYWDLYNLYGWAVSQNLPVDFFRWVGNASQSNKDFIENCNEDND